MTALQLGDAAGMCGMFFGAVILSRSGSMPNGARPFEVTVPLWYVLMLLLLLLLWHLIFRAFDLYHSRRLSARKHELLDVVKAAACGSVAVSCVLLFLPWRFPRWSFFFVFWAGSTLLAASTRMLMRWLTFHLRRRGRNLRHVLMFGTNPRATRLAALLLDKPELGYRLIGFIDSPWDGLAGFERDGGSCVANLDNYQEFIRHNVVDEIWISLPVRSQYGRIVEIGQFCVTQGIITRVATELFDGWPKNEDAADEIEGQPIITVGRVGKHFARGVKALLDRVLALLLLIPLAPVLLATSIAIYITSPGPILFRQLRLGLNKRPFWMLKFRTMVVDAEAREAALAGLNELEGPVFKIRNDPRITAVGKFLRQFSIDELPQIFNVLRGDMSLVGPRPLPLRDYSRFSEYWQLRRCAVRPGMSGLWQVSGRNTVQFDRWMSLDMQYIDEWSLWLDLKILLRTAFVIFRREGAW